jgi:hypothetical protein
MTVTARQPKGVPVGGQFAATTHADPSIQLQQLKEVEKVFALSPGTRVAVGNEFGIVSEAPDRNGRMKIKLDGHGSLIANSRDVVPWEAYLDTAMPAVDHNPDPETTEIPQADADRALRGSFVRMRNALESAGRTGDTYYHGIAFGEAEVAAALRDAVADPEMIGNARSELLKLGLPIGAEHEGLSPAAIKRRTSAPLTTLRARRLAGYFTARAVEMQTHNGAIAQKDWGTAEWTKQGAQLAYAKAAVRFAGALPQGDADYHEERFTRLLVEGETNVNTIIGETFDEHAW